MVPLVDRIRFKKRLLPIAETVREEYGIEPLLCVTQAAHESNWGESQLARVADNLFGMTATQSWYDLKKDVYPIGTREYSKFPPEKIRYWNRSGDIISKVSDGNGGSILMVEVDFRKYKNWDESVADWANKIATKERYKQAYYYAKTGDAKDFFASLQAGGWATDPNYALKMMGVYDVVLGLKDEDTQTIV